MQPTTYTTVTLAKKWACSTSQIRRMCADGTLKSFHLGKEYRIPEWAVTAYEGTPPCQEEGQNTHLSSPILPLDREENAGKLPISKPGRPGIYQHAVNLGKTQNRNSPAS